MGEHPIENLMMTAMNSIQNMVDVNTIVGEPIQAMNGITIIPISKVSLGFAAGGSEFNTNKLSKYSENMKLPFGGGSGAGVNISPVGFLVIKDGIAKVLNVDGINVVDRAVDMIPDIINKIDSLINKKMDKCDKKEKNKTKKVKEVDIDLDDDDINEEYYEKDIEE